MILGASSAVPLTLSLPFDEVAQNLAQEQNLVRIKKLLIYVCTQVWESDRPSLDQVNLVDLLQNLRAIAPTAAHLQSQLYTAAQSLNKAAEYTVVSNVIMTHVERLYSPIPPTPSQAPDLSNLFDLRLEIMQYTNPYRAKIVLFSLLHQPFTHSAEQESMVKAYTLDGLLRTMIQTYKLAEVEVQLLVTARKLEDFEECVQVAHVILGAIKPFYAPMPSTFKAQIAGDMAAVMESQAIDASPTERRLDSGRDDAGLAIALPNPVPHQNLVHQER